MTIPVASKCLICGEDVRYIDTYRSGVVKCNRDPIKGVTQTGRETEVFTYHECNNARTGDEPLQDKDGRAKQWTGGFDFRKG